MELILLLKIFQSAEERQPVDPLPAAVQSIASAPLITYRLPVTVMPFVPLTVPVATLAKVLTPEKYGMLPVTAGDEVESPSKPTVAPERVIGHVTERVACLLLKVVQSAEVRQPKTEPEAVSQFKAPAERVRPEPSRSVTKSEPTESCVVEAFTKTAVEDAMKEMGEPRIQRAVVVELTV